MTALDTEETVLTDTRPCPDRNHHYYHGPPLGPEHEAPRDKIRKEPDTGQKFPVPGIYRFIAYSFVTNDGNAIPVLPQMNYERFPNLPAYPVTFDDPSADPNPDAGTPSPLPLRMLPSEGILPRKRPGILASKIPL